MLLQLAQTYNEYKFIFGGSGDEALITKLKSFPNIEYIGFVREEDKVAFFEKIDFLILPSYYDAWGLVINEAFSTGTLAIVSNGVKAKEMIEKVDKNFIFENNNFNSLCSVCEYSLRLYNSPDYELLREKAVEISKEYSIEKASSQLMVGLLI